MEEFRQNHVPNDTNHRSRGQNRTLWRPPRRGWHKVNIDEAVLKEAGNYDVGAVVKNEKGELMGAMCKKNTFPIGGFGGGSKSGRRRNYLCNGSQSWGSNNRRRYFNGNVCPWESWPLPISIQKVVEGIRMTLKALKMWKTNHVRRHCNIVAHLLARHACNIDDCVIWVEDTPLMIANQICMDVLSLGLYPI